MAATFPGGVHDFGAPHIDDVDEIIHAASINELMVELSAVETWLRGSVITNRTPAVLTLSHGAQDYNTTASTTVWGEPSWYVDAAGVCHWSGTIDPHGVTSAVEFITGAPAPADGKIHGFPILAYNDPNSTVAVDTYSLATSAGWHLPTGSPYSNAFFTYEYATGFVTLSGVINSGSTYGYGSYISSLPKPCDYQWHFFWVNDVDGANQIQLLLDQYGNLLTGPLCNNGSSAQAHIGHNYSLEGVRYKASAPTELLVMANGNGRIDGLIPLGTTQAGDAGYAGGGHLYLDNISYYVGL